MKSSSATIHPGGGIPRAWWRYLAKGLLLCLAAGAAVSIFNIDRQSWGRLLSIPAGVVLLMLLMVATAWACNGMRTWLLARAFKHRLSLQRAVGITLSMEFAIAATPGGLGGLPTRILLQRRSGIPVHQSLTMIAADISADILFFVLLSPLALRSLWRIQPVHEFIRQLSWIQAGSGAGGALLGAALLWIARRPLCRRAMRIRRLRRLLVRIRREFRQMRLSVAWLWRHGRGWYLGAFLFCSLQWTCRYGILPVILWALGSPIDPLALVYLQGLLFLTALLVVVPGGGGSIELLTTWILQPVAGAPTAALAVICWRVFTYYLYILAGVTAAIIQIRIPARAHPSLQIPSFTQQPTHHDHPSS